MKASDAIAKFLISNGIDTCFELVGGMITHMLDSLAESKKFNIISMHHEQSAAFAAEGVARCARGKRLAVAMGTSGPGATNMITGIGSCWFDSVPCLFITGQVNTNELRRERNIRQQGFQELDIVELVKSITKYAVRVETVEELLPELHKAVSTSIVGRQGPVLIDIPNNIQRMEINDETVVEWINKPIEYEFEKKISCDQIGELKRLCAASHRPMICIGGGAVWADNFGSWIERVDRFGIPYVSTLMGHERVVARECYFNMIGSYGNREANWAIQQCDLLIVIGSRLDVRQTGSNLSDFARSAKIVQVDIDPAQLNNRVSADLNICATAENFYKAFKPSGKIFPRLKPEWLITLKEKRKIYSSDEYVEWKLSPHKFFNSLNQAFLGKEVEYVCDVGNHQMWAAHSLRLQEGQAVHYSGGMGAMGFALPSAIGISVSSRRKTVVITGDGSIQLNIQELDTLKRLKLNVVVVVMNNSILGMVKNFQDMYFDGRNQSTERGYSNPPFADIAEAYGIPARRINDDSELTEAVEMIAEYKGPLVIELMMPGATECRPRLAFGSKLDDQYPQNNA